jgi:hypothetical protein
MLGHTVKAYDKELEVLGRKIAEMGGIAEKMLSDATATRVSVLWAPRCYPSGKKRKFASCSRFFGKWFHRETIPYRMQIRLMNYFHANVEIIDWAPDAVASSARPKTLSELCREKFLTPSGRCCTDMARSGVWAVGGGRRLVHEATERVSF